MTDQTAYHVVVRHPDLSGAPAAAGVREPEEAPMPQPAATTWYEEMLRVSIAQQAPRGPGSRRAAQALADRFSRRVGIAYRALPDHKPTGTSEYERVRALDEAGVPCE